MIQIPLPSTDSIRIEVPLPANFERLRDVYLVTGADKLLVFLLLAAGLYFITRYAKRAISQNIEDVNRKHALRKLVTYGYVLFLLLLAVALFADWLTGLGAILAVLVAGIAIALQDVLKSVVGWIYLSGRSGIEIGSRIEVQGIVGDVIDIGMLKTTLLEVGGELVYGRQSTGRLVSVPNYRMLSESVLIAHASSPYVWQEVKVTLTFESDWQRAQQILEGIGEELFEQIAPQLERGFSVLERRYAFKQGSITPIVYIALGEAGIDLALRFLVHTRRRRGAVHTVTRRILLAFAAEPRVRLAYPTYRVFRSEEAMPVGPAGGLGDSAPAGEGG